ncbi:MAG: homoserine dehydrogenase [Candidatus Geothermarchaeales archaeon]
MRVILVGFGFVGKSFVETIHRKIEILKSVDGDFKLVGVSDVEGYAYNKDGLDLRRLSSMKKISEYPEGFHKEESSVELIEGCDADVVVEATPTNIVDGEPGLTHIRRALARNMHVVTSNKGPMVLAYRELTDLARRRNLELRYEATVAGAVPVFSLINRCLQGDKISRISGIFNGTTNYILSKMYFEGTSFELALKEAQERGIAERDPTYDIEAIDPACKIVILANALMGRNVRLEDVRRMGISRINPEAVNLAKDSGYAIKLIGVIDETLEVAPRLIPLNHPLCVHGTLNAVHFETDLAGEITIVGHGAGMETVSAMVNDVISIGRRHMAGMG